MVFAELVYNVAIAEPCGRHRLGGKDQPRFAISRLFGGDEPRHPLPWHAVVSRSLLVFAVGLLLVRVGKSRLLGRVTPVDVLPGFCLGSVMSRGMTGSASLSATCLSSAALVGLHWALSATACRWHRFGELLKGHSVELVRDGKIDWEAMEQSHMSEHDLLEQLRLNGNVAEAPDAKRAVKERSGEISVIRESSPRVLEIRVEQGVQTVRIEVGR